MRRTKARLSLPSLSFVHNWERRGLTNGSSNRLDSFRKYSPLRVGAKQEVLAVGDPVSGSGAAEPLSNHRRGHRRADGEAHRGPRPLGEDERCAADDHALLRSSYDAFWLARFLKTRGIECLVIDPGSLQVSLRVDPIRCLP